MTLVRTRTAPALSINRVMIPLTTGGCLILLAVILKNVLLVPAQQLASDMVLYIIIYLGFIVTFQYRDAAQPESPSRTLFWISVILLITFGIIAVYAI